MPKPKKTALPNPTPWSLNIWFQDQIADKGLWHSIIGAFIGGFLAIFAGLAVYSIQTSHQQTQELRAKTEQKRILLEGLERSLRDNIQIMDGLIDPKKFSIIIMNNLNLTYFESTSQLKYQTLENIELAEEIDNLNFRMSSLEQAIRNFQSIYFNPLSSTDKNFLKTKGLLLQKNIIVGTQQTLLIANTVLRDVLLEREQLEEKDHRANRH